MKKDKMTFALAFCNRGFMPGELIRSERGNGKGCKGCRI